MNVINKVFGTHSQRELKRIMPIVDKIESMRNDMMDMEDEELKGRTKEFKKRLEEGETLDDILPEAFAVVREAARRVLNMEPYRVQLIGGIILHQGRIAEMRTGEGKTLVSTLPASHECHIQLRFCLHCSIHLSKKTPAVRRCHRPYLWCDLPDCTHAVLELSDRPALYGIFQRSRCRPPAPGFSAL